MGTTQLQVKSTTTTFAATTTTASITTATSAVAEQKTQGIKKPVIMIAGDSIIKEQKGWLMSREKMVKVYSFSGATTEEMKYFLQPLLERKPSHVILHCGTNDPAQGSSCKEVTQRIISLGKDVVNNDITCSVSILTTKAVPLVSQVNNILEKLAKSEPNIDIINNDSIRSDYHLNSSGVYLNRKGDAALARNYIQYLKSNPNL